MEPARNTPSPDAPRGRPGSFEVQVRSSPRFWPFVCTGAALGILVAFVSAYTGAESTEFTRGSVASFLAVLFGLAGVLLGAVAYLVVDGVLRRRYRRATAVPLDESDASQ